MSDYAHLYQRQELNIAKASDARNALPTPKRLVAYRKSPTDTGLEELIFRFGRYLMIQTSRPGSLPAGLQGIWNGMIAAPWEMIIIVTSISKWYIGCLKSEICPNAIYP